MCLLLEPSRNRTCLTLAHFSITPTNQTTRKTVPTPPPTRVSQRNELAKLELRIDRLEFELRKSIHQIQTSKSDHQQTEAAAGGANNPPDPRLLTESNRATNMASSGLSSSWVDGGAGGRQLESSMTSGRQEDSKLIDLGERLNLVEKFITITTTKVSLAQSVDALLNSSIWLFIALTCQAATCDLQHTL